VVDKTASKNRRPDALPRMPNQAQGRIWRTAMLLLDLKRLPRFPTHFLRPASYRKIEQGNGSKVLHGFKLPFLGSNQDSPNPNSGGDPLRNYGPLTKRTICIREICAAQESGGWSEDPFAFRLARNSQSLSEGDSA
jgi:hypothetical protein